MTKSFFEEQKEQSLIKASIVEKYFGAWAKVMISVIKKSHRPNVPQKIAYIDLFAGAGRYKDGSESTPLKVLEKAIEDDDMRDMLVSLFNDVDKNNVQSLESAISQISGIEKLKYPPKIINREIGENIVQMFEEQKLVPTLFFVDPWGYKGLSLKLINSVVKNWGCDCIFFFNYNRVNMGLGNDAVKKHIDSLFGEDLADQLRNKIQSLPPSEREFQVVEALCEALQGMGGEYVLPFRFKHENGNRTSHHLIFVSKHIKGYEIMKDIMAKESSETNQGISSFEYNPATIRQPFLFEFTKPLEDLANMLLHEFSGKTMTMLDIYNSHHIGKPYTKSNYKKALILLESQGKIKDNSKVKRRKNTFADKVEVTFPDL